MFKKNLKVGIGFVLMMVSSAALAGVLMEEWTELNDRFCKYSDGKVKKISISEICPRSN